MNGVVEHRFRTKTGTCIITAERIVLERQGIRGTAAKGIYGNTINRALIIYGVLGMFALVAGSWLLANKSYVSGGALCLVSVCCLWNVFVSRNNSATAVIERSTIQSVEAHAPRPPLTRGYFLVRFLEKGEERRRLIMLPGSMSHGNEEYHRALSAMREAGLMDGKQGNRESPSA